MKAKQLYPDLFPQKEVVKAYQDVGQEYELSTHDRVYQSFFYPKATGNSELKEQDIEQKIDHLTEAKTQKVNGLLTMFCFSHMIGGNRIDYSYTEGKIENMPVFQKKINPQTKEVVPEHTQVLELKDVYTIPFSKQKVNELQKDFTTDRAVFIIIDRTTGKRYSCNSLAEFRDLVLYSSTLTKIIPGTNMIIY
jgi:hypothetical protein